MEKTVLVGVITNDQGYEKSIDYLEELEFLTVTAGGFVNKIFTQKLNNPNPKTFIGEGKINEIRDYIKENDVIIYKLTFENWISQYSFSFNDEKSSKLIS